MIDDIVDVHVSLTSILWVGAEVTDPQFLRRKLRHTGSETVGQGESQEGSQEERLGLAGRRHRTGGGRPAVVRGVCVLGGDWSLPHHTHLPLQVKPGDPLKSGVAKWRHAKLPGSL